MSERIFTTQDGPQATIADAYQHAAHMLTAIATSARLLTHTPAGPIYIHVERIDQLAAALADRAEQARQRDGST
jgi:hypothetical protein